MLLLMLDMGLRLLQVFTFQQRMMPVPQEINVDFRMLTSARSCTCVWANPGMNTGWTENGLGTALRRTWGCWWVKNST